MLGDRGENIGVTTSANNRYQVLLVEFQPSLTL